MTLAAAKEYLVIEDDALDGTIEGFITAAAGKIEDTTSTRLVEQTVELLADSFSDLSLLPIGPVLEVAELTYLDPNGAEQPLENSDFELFGAGLERGIRPAFGQRWPSAAKCKGAVRVVVSVGYEALPMPLWLAILQMVGAMFANREEPGGVPVPIDALVNHRVWG